MDFSGFRRTTLGISGDDLTPQLAEYFGAKQGKGVLISEVTKGGAADRAGLKAGDVIVQVDGKPISGVGELREALDDNFTADTRKVSLTIVRNHQELTVSAELTRPQMRERHISSTLGPIYRQQMQEQDEWQRQLRDQMSAMKDQLKQLQNLHVDVRQDGEI